MTKTDYQFDGFISYSSKDNKKWVSKFKENIDEFTNHRYGLRRRLNFFLDQNSLEGNFPLEGRLRTHLNESRTLIIFLSRNYLESEWCKKELSWNLIRQEFKKNNIFIIRMERLDLSGMPPNLQVLNEIRGYDFFVERDGIVVPLQWPHLDRTDPNETRLFDQKLKELIGNFISFLRETSPDEFDSEDLPIDSNSANTTSDKGSRETGLSPNTQFAVSPSCGLFDLTKARALIQRLLPEGSEVELSAEDYFERVKNYDAFKNTLSLHSRSAKCLVQFVGSTTSFNIPNDDFSSTTLDLDTEYKIAKAHNENLKRILVLLSAEGTPTKEHLGDLILNWSEANDIAIRIVNFLNTEEQTKVVPPGEDRTVLFDFRDNLEDERVANYLMDHIQDSIGCDVDTLADKIGRGDAQEEESLAKPMRAHEQATYRKIKDADLTILLKKMRTNRDLRDRRKRLRSILRMFDEDERIRLKGFIANLDRDEKVGRIGLLETVDLREVDLDGELSETGKTQLEEFLLKLSHGLEIGCFDKEERLEKIQG